MISIRKNLPLKSPQLTWQSALPYILLIGGLLGMLASFTLTYDKIHVLQDASYQPSCNLNPIISCGSVMKTQQASLLGVPNTVFGLIAFSMLTMYGLALLAGAAFKQWLWRLAQLGATAGMVFMHYLFFQSVFRIHTICPWCFLVWMITIFVFFSLTIYNVRMRHLPGSVKIAPFINKYGNDIVIIWYLIIFGTLIVKFWYYWSTLL